MGEEQTNGAPPEKPALPLLQMGALRALAAYARERVPGKRVFDPADTMAHSDSCYMSWSALHNALSRKNLPPTTFGLKNAGESVIQNPYYDDSFDKKTPAKIRETVRLALDEMEQEGLTKILGKQATYAITAAGMERLENILEPAILPAYYKRSRAAREAEQGNTARQSGPAITQATSVEIGGLMKVHKSDGPDIILE